MHNVWIDFELIPSFCEISVVSRSTSAIACDGVRVTPARTNHSVARPIAQIPSRGFMTSLRILSVFAVADKRGALIDPLRHRVVATTTYLTENS